MNIQLSKGLTLIEILVVIAIIAIIAAIMFPVFSRAKQAAKQTDSLNRLGQVGVAIQLYSADYDDLLPFAAGNNCYMLALTLNKDCGLSLDPDVVIAAGPINSSLIPYSAPFSLYKSNIDKIDRVLLQEPGHKTTWFEETTTANFPGSSFEYNNLLGLNSKSQSSTADTSTTAIMYSLFTIDEETAPKKQILFLDGHLKTTSNKNWVLSYD